MLLERLLDNLSVRVEPFARCDVASGCCLALDGLGWVTLHFVLAGEGELLTRSGRVEPLRPGTLAVVPARVHHRIRCGDGVEITRADPARAPVDVAGLPRFAAAHAGSDTTTKPGAW